MVIGNPDAVAAAAANAGDAAGANSMSHPSGIPQDKIDNIMSGIANTGDVKLNNHRKKLRQRFDIIKKLGQGTYGKVQLGINKETGQEVAIKTIKKCKIEAEADLVRIRREVQIMSSVQHPNIIHIYEVFENREKMVLVMEFAAGGELYDYLSERKVLNEEEARRIFRQVATAVYYCHKHKICHRDLKLENILLDEHGHAKIADFGLSNVFDDQRLLATFCGSPLYASPEIVEGTPYHGPEVDCWSLGVLLYTLVYGSMPFDGSNFKRLVKQISQGDYYEPKNPSRASSLIRDMLTVCPRKRATIEQICSHWWVNENDNMSCLDLAEDLANQTPVRLDVLLSLTPTAITADQMVVPSADGNAAGKGSERVPRSHSVGSILDIGGATEAERRILDMVAAGGEAALMPSPTRTITPAQSPVQSKRKLQTTVSTENATGSTVKKKEKPGSSSRIMNERPLALNEETPMEVEDAIMEEPSAAPIVKSTPSGTFSQKDMEMVGDLCEQLIQDTAAPAAASPVSPVADSGVAAVPQQKPLGKLDAVVETAEEKDATKVIKKFVNKHKTADLVNAIGQIAPEKQNNVPAAATSTTSTAVAAASMPSSKAANSTSSAAAPPPFVRKCSLQDESQLKKFSADRRKSRILETAEKFQQMNAGNGSDKPKKVVIPGISVGSYKKEFESKATTTPVSTGPTAGELRAMEQVAAAAAAAQELENAPTPPSPSGEPDNAADSALEASDSKTSVTSLSLEDARRSMENSIALLRQAQNESSKEVDQLCAKTESFGVSDTTPAADSMTATERERKLKNARAIIGNAIQPVIRRPLPPPSLSLYGIGGGGYGAHLRAPSSGGFIDYSGDGISPSPPIYAAQPLPRSPPPVLAPNANAALAGARQNIMERLAAATSGDGVQHQHHGIYNVFPHQKCLPTSATAPSMKNFFYNNYNAPQQQTQAQYHNHNHHYQQQQKQLQQHLFHPPTPTTLPSQIQPPYVASFAAAANAISNATINSVPKPFYNAPPPSKAPSYPSSTSLLFKSSPGGDPNSGSGTVKTSTASITLKSATLPRRKTAKTEIQLDIKPRILEQPAMRFTTEMQHPVPDLRSAPPREGPIPYSPIKTSLSARATSLEPKEHIIPIQRPQAPYARTTSNTTTRSGSLSRQSTVDSESDTTTTGTNMSQSTLTGSSQPIKKSPREFIIPIAIEGGGFITPREGSIEPSESNHTTTSSRSTFSRLRPTRRIGSLLSDTGVEEPLPFQKMRTPSINRDGDDDTRFTLRRLRSSRPVKKISEDNDSQSSGEEDDDDGFEILTAENLFSTLLQRVRALTNRLNVNNDLTAGFPNSSRLLSNMRQAQSPFWNQEPFGRSQVSYSYSQTVEKKQVRLKSGDNVGAPWRHSLSRDLGSDMESMFSRTGATLPRGNKANKGSRTTIAEAAGAGGSNVRCPDNTDGKQTAEEPLDLADLDLSRLRLSKKDLETLSSIAPGLPKCFQEQLLAKLPPTQARKLSRTLSLQNSPLVPSVKIYKRSQSGGRGVLHEATALALPPSSILQEHLAEETAEGGGSSRTSDDSSERTLRSSLYRRSVSRSRYDNDAPSTQSAETPAATLKSRSSSVCRDDYSKSLCTSAAYSSDINDKYKYYSPYLSKPVREYSSTESGSVSPQKRYGTASLREATAAALGRPPSGCLSPPPSAATVPTLTVENGSSSLRRLPSQRHRISRFLRPDFFDEQPLDENPYQRERRLRERETQSVLREIREKSREPSRERLSVLDDEPLRRKHSLPNEELELGQKPACQHVRNKSMEVYTDSGDRQISSQQETAKRHRRSLSRPRDISVELDKHELADKILQELQLLSAVRSRQEKCMSVPREISVERTTEIITHTRPKGVELETAVEGESNKQATGTIKKVKKVKPKEKSTESNTTDGDAKTTTTTVVRKIKKIVRKTEVIRTPTTENAAAEPTLDLPTAENDSMCNAKDASEAPKKESKLKRPKSYPTKEVGPASGAKAEMVSGSAVLPKLPAKQPPTIPESKSELVAPNVANCSTARESRLIRPKSYPASKLTPPKDTKKVTRSGIAIANIAESSHTSSALTSKSNSVSGQSVCDEKHSIASPTLAKDSIDTPSSNESHPTTIKKIVKVAKKSKLLPPTPISPITPTTPNTTATSSTADESSKESSPTVREQLKEKSPEKKHSKGLFYALGQKFEKLRDSAMNKEKKTTAVGSTACSFANMASNTTTKKSSPENSSPDVVKEKTILLKKKSTKTDKAVLAMTKDTTTKLTKVAKTTGDTEKPAPKDKRSRIDAMIRSLRERSVPRSIANSSESNYIKRAVSVEEMPGTFNRNAVNKVLGLFKRFEKDGGERRVRSTRSTSNIERQIRESSPSPIYQNAAVECAAKKSSAGSNKNNPTSTAELSRSRLQCNCEITVPAARTSQLISCSECIQHPATASVSKAQKRDETPKSTGDSSTQPGTENGQGNRDKRKGLMLDLVKLEKPDNGNTNPSRNSKIATAYTNGNGNGIYSNLPPYPSSSNNSSSQQSVDNATNNNNNNNPCITNNNGFSKHTSQTSGYRTSSAHEINRNHLLTPSNENIANYSSDSRSCQDDCASTSTFLSPTDEPELYFDNWSICSEDNYMLHATPSPTVSRLSRASQLSSPTRGGESSDPNESVIDRIKRRSFYCRFNEKKPKRTSSIVGPSATRDYYREQQAAVKARSSNKLSNADERGSSPDITHEFFRPLKLSPVGTELKPPVYKSPHDYASSAVGKSRKSLNDIRPITSTSPSFLSKRFGSAAVDSDYLSLTGTMPSRFKSSSSSSPYESNGAAAGSSTYYSTYNPKRRSSYTLNGILPHGGGSTHLASSNIDGYATVGRRSIRPYDHRTVSLLDPSATAGASSYRRDALASIRDYTSSISRSNSRYRTSSTSRSPTNI